MAHIPGSKSRLVARVRRIKGQLAAIETDIEQDGECHRMLQAIAACRGALNGLMAEVISGHVRHHVIDPAVPPTPAQQEAADQLMEVIKTYLK